MHPSSLIWRAARAYTEALFNHFLVMFRVKFPVSNTFNRRGKNVSAKSAFNFNNIKSSPPSFFFFLHGGIGFPQPHYSQVRFTSAPRHQHNCKCAFKDLLLGSRGRTRLLNLWLYPAERPYVRAPHSTGAATRVTNKQSRARLSFLCSNRALKAALM